MGSGSLSVDGGTRRGSRQWQPKTSLKLSPRNQKDIDTAEPTQLEELRVRPSPSHN